jgi:hypothetical protein
MVAEITITINEKTFLDEKIAWKILHTRNINFPCSILCSGFLKHRVEWKLCISNEGLKEEFMKILKNPKYFNFQMKITFSRNERSVLLFEDAYLLSYEKTDRYEFEGESDLEIEGV